MYTVSILASPVRADLDDDTIIALQRRWGGGRALWLDHGTAAEFPVETPPEDFDAAWAELDARGFDLAVQTTAGRRKAVLLADMDSTMIGQECIDELADMAGVGPRVAAITARAMNGELDFHESLIARVALLEGLPDSVIAQVLDSRITLAAGGPTLVATMRANGAWTALVSGGFTDFTGPVARRIGFDEQRANVLLSDDSGQLSGRVALPILGREAKVEALRDITAARGLTPADAIAVGDGANDLGMLQLAGTGVALHAKPVVAAQAPIRINHGDLTALLYLQGYGRDEFVTGAAG
ncbi:phosphoserine phosphatase [Paracoccus solventivorans]|uniref:Phosphoserine phosphatase n=1 Tax=Paracoccus solventivorans TaxID=53463 RepID=A0A1M7J3L2_9RHOB|nr:phosphoserine phosphatase SerB [Paracoccus solventivorans]SHM47585.1 phosphoserine phosphatase [Paracoccus solventivorans]